MNQTLQTIKENSKTLTVLAPISVYAIGQICVSVSTIQLTLICYFLSAFAFLIASRYPKFSRTLLNFIVGVYPFLCLTIDDSSRIIAATFFFLGSVLQFFLGRDLKDFTAYIIANVIGAVVCSMDMYYSPHHYSESVFLPVFQNTNLRAQLWMAVIALLSMSFMLALSRQQAIGREKTHEQSINKLNVSLRKAIKEKDNFILRFSHEIRNPLNSLLGNIDMLSELITDKALIEMITDTKVCGEILLQLLNNILDSAKISERNLEVALKPSVTREFFEKIWVVCSEMIKSKKLYGALYMNENVPEYLMLDSHRIMQIMINMVSNATKFTDHGYVSIHIDFVEGDLLSSVNMEPVYVSSQFNTQSDSDGLATYATEQDINEKGSSTFRTLDLKNKKFPKQKASPISQVSTTASLQTPQSQIGLGSSNNLPEIPPKRKGYLRIEVNDSGCGMDAAKIGRLFHKFSQVNDQSTKRQIGTGLGLWITKELVELLKGYIKVYSGVNQGTCFTIAIKTETCQPISSFSHLKQPPPSSDIEELPQRPKPLRVLVLEDGPYNQDVKRRFLGRLGFDEINIVGDGEAGLQIFKTRGPNYFDLIISDLDMPILDGYSACMLMRKHEVLNGWEKHPIVIVTGHPTPTVKSKCLDPNGEIQAMRFIPKPVSFGSLKEVCEELDLSPQMKTNEAVLVAEDDLFNLKLMQDMITRCGKRVIVAPNGKLAVEAYMKNKQDISLIFMDCEMPIMNGIEAAKAISQEIKTQPNEAQRAVKIIGLTGHIDEKIKQNCLENGMESVLTKPINVRTIEQMIWSSRSTKSML